MYSLPVILENNEFQQDKKDEQDIISLIIRLLAKTMKKTFLNFSKSL